MGARNQFEVKANLGQITIRMHQIPGSLVWEVTIPCADVPAGVHSIHVTVEEGESRSASDEIRTIFGPNRPSRERAERDLDNALEA